MKQLNFSINIDAPKKKVWQVLWNDDTYRKWTEVFSEGSYAESDWNEGSKIHFLSPEGEGMYSKIEKKIPDEYMSFKHLGVMKEGKEQPLDEEAKKWAGAMENYTLKQNGNSTELKVDLQIAEGNEKYFDEKFPKALEKVKELSEG
jgi:hypothetical protein